MKCQMWQILPTKRQFYLSELISFSHLPNNYMLRKDEPSTAPWGDCKFKLIIVIPFPMPVINLDICRKHSPGQ